VTGDRQGVRAELSRKFAIVARRLVAAAALFLVTQNAAWAQGLDLSVAPPSVPAPSPTTATAPAGDDELSGFLAAWAAQAARARATQPSWSSPLVTTTALLEQRLRFDVEQQHAGNGASTTVLDGGRGLDLIVSDTNEIQIAAPPYEIRSTPSGKGELSGFGDWTFLRVEQRLASAPAGAGNYVVTAWLQVQAPTGIEALSSHVWEYIPTLAFGKGWGAFDIQATVGAVLPDSHTDTLGNQIQTNVAFQYHVWDVFWPQIETNWTYYDRGQRSGLNQVFLTPGVVIGRFALGGDRFFTFGFGYQFAVSPSYRASPLTPAYQHAWLFTSRLNF
jgi:hypothetical protein